MKQMIVCGVMLISQLAAFAEERGSDRVDIGENDTGGESSDIYS